jgi:tRNA nucleotidyltransferase (CCA-adding enzyme)
MDVITSHINADFDALASVVAAKKLYPYAVIVFPGSLEKKVRDYVDVFHPVQMKRLRDISLEDIERLIIVDTKHADRLGNLKEILSKPDLKIHIYDHHPVDKSDIKGELEVIDNVGAVSTIFTEIIQKQNIPITPEEATLLCLGIYEETGSLTFSSTTPRDLMAVAYLLKKGANLNIVSEFLKVELSREEFALLNELIQSLKEVVVHGVRVKIAKGTMEGFGDVAHLAHRIMDMEETDAIVLLISMADKILMVARSKVAEMDAAKVLADFGGGGHPTAASATIKDIPLELLEERLIESLHKNIRPLKLAGDIMTTPVIVISYNSTIKEAEDTMTRYGVNVLPVVKEGKYLGILTREVVEKAIFHSLSNSRCEDFATIDAFTVSIDTPISEIEKAMIERNQRFVPVIEGQKIIGAITRTDILRSIYEDFLRKSRISPLDKTTETTQGYVRNVAKLLKERLPEYLFEFLKKAGEIADKLGFNAYLVGGCVRDLLRGERNLDIDIVIEGDGIAFAKRLAEVIGAKVITHERFGTAQILISQESKVKSQQPVAESGVKSQESRVKIEELRLKIDVATARTEYYERPAALPMVEASSIKKDLYRRDFTINTLAVKLNTKDFGLLIDYFGGQRDLRDRVIRVLHNLSFIEDPTRAFRAIRFSERFGFKLSKHTESLIKSAVRMNIFEKLSGTRLYDELMLTFDETDPIKALKRLADYYLLKVIHPKIVFTPEMESLLRSVHDTIAWFKLLFLDEKYNKGVLYIMALLYKLNAEERELALKRLSVSLNMKEKIVKGLSASQEILRKLKPDNPVEIYNLLSKYEIESILFSMALTEENENKKAISHFLVELRNIKPLLTGKDLKALGITPGPKYSQILKRILNEKLMKRLKSKEEEIEFVKRLENLI